MACLIREGMFPAIEPLQPRSVLGDELSLALGRMSKAMSAKSLRFNPGALDWPDSHASALLSADRCNNPGT